MNSIQKLRDESRVFDVFLIKDTKNSSFLTRKAEEAQIKLPRDKTYGLSVNMGGDDKTLVAIV